MAGSVVRIFKSIVGAHDDNVYGLDHAILNVAAPPETLWMNMGYWKDTASFPTACQALLDKVLGAAGLLNQDDSAKSLDQSKHTRLIDVGFGCGDQSLYLTRTLRRTELRSTDGGGKSNEEIRPLFDSYIGMNITSSQVDVARKRLVAASKEEASTPKVDVFAADAGNPAAWDTEIWEALKPHTKTETQTWLLALDTMYHFKPSRMPLLQCAYRDMQASIMAFDLLLSESASFWDKLFLWLVCLVAGIPYSNFMTPTAYKDMLVRAGYAADSIRMEDISEHVFSGIAGFIRAKDAELGKYGMTVGKFTGPAKIFGWWGETGVVRGLVVVAHRT